MMQIEGIIRDTPQPHLEFSGEAELPEGAIIVMLKTTLFKQKAERKDRGWTLELPAEACTLPMTEGTSVEIWLAPEANESLTQCPQALQEALLANRSAYYFFQLLDAEQRERIVRYAEQGAEEQRIRRIDKIIAMLYERRTL